MIKTFILLVIVLVGTDGEVHNTVREMPDKEVCVETANSLAERAKEDKSISNFAISCLRIPARVGPAV